MTAPPRWPWFERPFRFDYPPEKYPEVVERFRGTPARLEERLHGVSDAVFKWSDGAGWTIIENVGHLAILDGLTGVRIAQVVAGAAELEVADLTNQATHEAGFNQRQPADVLAEFRAGRAALIAQCECVPRDAWSHSALHPRLRIPMRPADLLTFFCEHDDYHLARIAALLRAAQESGVS